MVDATLLRAILDSMDGPILFADTSHTTRYMNKAAIAHYKGGEDLLDRSLMDCHNENSQRLMIEILAAMQAGEEDERLILEDEERRVFMRAVRDRHGRVVGYFERFEPKSG